MSIDLALHNHIAKIHVKISDNLSYSDLDRRVVELAAQKFGNLENSELVNPQNLLLFQIIGETCETEDFTRYREGDNLFEDWALFDWVSEAYGKVESRCPISEFLTLCQRTKTDSELKRLEYLAVNVKLSLAHGYLYRDADGDYSIRTQLERPWPQEKLIGYGFYMDIWNNCIPDFSKETMGNMMGRVTAVIKDEYSQLVEILQEEIR